jgi:enoyl-CoA hydratase/carnithine racemase
MGGTIRVERDPADTRIAWLIFDHPERRNAIDAEMWRCIPDIARELDADDTVRVVVLRGAGEISFVAGADISEFEAQRDESASANYEAETERALEAIAALRKPVLAMIRGYCIGGGVAIALAADIRFAAQGSQFAIPAARLGIGYSTAGIDTLIRLVGPSRAKELFFTARHFAAEEALAMGLINALMPPDEIEARVRETAVTIAGNAPLTLASVKCIARELARSPEARDTRAAEASIRDCFESDDYREGVRAFLEKRAPKFQGH